MKKPEHPVIPGTVVPEESSYRQKKIWERIEAGSGPSSLRSLGDKGRLRGEKKQQAPVIKAPRKAR